MRILVFSYYYPPGSEVGGRRFAALAENWEKNGSQVTVIAAEKDAYRSVDEDQTVPGRVIRSRVRPLPRPKNKDLPGSIFHRFWQKSMIYLDMQQGWIRHAVEAGTEAVTRTSSEVIVATGPPFSAVVAGSKVAEKLNIPFVLDYRDPWTTQKSGRFPPPLGPLPGKFLEKRILRKAAAAVCCSKRLRKQIEDGFRFAESKLFTITNGFSPMTMVSAAASRDEFTILYAGTFYGRRSLAPLLQGIKRLRSKSIKVRVRVLGQGIPVSDFNVFNEAGIGDCLDEAGVVSYQDAQREMCSADVLYLPSGDDVLYALPFKLFDYLSAGKPVLSVSPSDSAVADFMGEHNCGANYTWDDARGIADYLEILSSADETKRSCLFADSEREPFLWSSIAGRYMQVLENCTK